MQSTECIGFEQKLKRCDGSKNFSVSKLRWSLLSDSLAIGSNFGVQRRRLLIYNPSQGMLHGSQTKCDVVFIGDTGGVKVYHFAQELSAS